MRESEIYRILKTYNKEITQSVGMNFRMFAQAILDLAIYRETWDEIVFNKKRLIWVIILIIFKPIKANEYFAKLYNEKKFKRLDDEKKELEAKLKAKEAACSGQKTNETSMADSKKGIVLPKSKIVDTYGKPLSSK